ncbi:MAG: hypothetical protein MJZ76_09620 [Bacteroidales bacterium]|nr:hypothetical protein [Bacteroidales bacterium]
MPTWLTLLLVAVLIGGIIGFFASDGDPKGCLFGAIEGGAGCGGILLKIFIWGTVILLAIKLFVWLFD